MADITTNYATTMRKHQGITPYGNVSAIVCRMETNASGALVDSDTATAIQIADVVRLGPVLPAGMQLLDAIVQVSDAFTAATTCMVGFEYCDGVDVAAVPEDADYFITTGGVTNAQGRLAMNNDTVLPVTLPKDCYVIITNEGAAHASVGILDVIVEGIMHGVE